MKSIQTPIDEYTRKSLKAGEEILLSGFLYTGRDAAHKRFLETVENTGSLPIDFRDQIIYYTGPTPEKPNSPIGACGPTSSYRMDSYSIPLMNLGLKTMIGKGERGDAFQKALADQEALYLIAIGGIGAVLSKCVVSSEIILYEDLGAEAVRKLLVKDFPVIVAYDSQGHSIFR